MAEMLLARGADPNANVYTSGSPFYRAYSEKNQDFVKLLEEHGGFLDAICAGYPSSFGRRFESILAVEHVDNARIAERRSDWAGSLRVREKLRCAKQDGMGECPQ